MAVASTRQYIEQLIADSRVVEIRHLPSGRSGLFDDPAALMRALAGVPRYGGLYSSLNQPSATASNAFGTRALRDADIVRIKRIAFDFDPVRPAGEAACGSQLDAANRASLQLASDLLDYRFPEPLIGASGNGYHLQYRVDLPATATTKGVFRRLYAGLAQRYSTDEVVFDATVRNPARILRLYGTPNRKGGEVRGTRCWIPDSWDLVDHGALARLAEDLSPVAEIARRSGAPCRLGAGDYATLDVVSMFQAHGLYEEEIRPGLHAVICPWEDEHSSSSAGDTVILEADGRWPNFRCHHAHCDGRGIREVMQVLGDADAFCSSPFRGS